MNESADDIRLKLQRRLKAPGVAGGIIRNLDKTTRGTGLQGQAREREGCKRENG